MILRLIILLAFLSVAGCNKMFATSIHRIAWSAIAEHYSFSACHLGVVHEQTKDSVTFRITKSTQKYPKQITIKIDSINFPRGYPKEYIYFLMDSNSNNEYVFNLSINTEKEANNLYERGIWLLKIIKIKDFDKKIVEYKKWLFTLCESKYPVVKREGFYEWAYGGFHNDYIQEYAEKYNLLDSYGIPMEEAKLKYITSKDSLRVLNVIFNTKYPTYTEWQVLYSFIPRYNKEIKSYIYSFFKRYTANFDENKQDIEDNRIQTGMAFNILSKIESDKKILSILFMYNRDDDRYIMLKQKQILDKYIIPVINALKTNGQ